MSASNDGNSVLTPQRIISGILAILAIIFAVLNWGPATLNLFGLTLTLPGVVWLAALLIVGWIVGSMNPWFKGKK